MLGSIAAVQAHWQMLLPLNHPPCTREECPLCGCEKGNNLGTPPIPAGQRERRSRCEGAPKQPVVREAPEPPQQRGRRCVWTRRPSRHLELGIANSLVKRMVKIWRQFRIGKWSQIEAEALTFLRAENSFSNFWPGKWIKSTSSI